MTSKLSDWKTIRIPCKQCAKEFDFKCPLELYETLRAAAEKDGGEDVIFRGTCPECRKGDPLLAAMDKYGIRTLGNNKGSGG